MPFVNTDSINFGDYSLHTLSKFLWYCWLIKHYFMSEIVLTFNHRLSLSLKIYALFLKDRNRLHLRVSLPFFGNLCLKMSY